MRKPKIFIAMPFKKELDNVEAAITEYGHSKEYDVWRADQERVSVEIFKNILGKIAESDVIIADVTYENPNVFLEIGYSWGIGKEVLLISEDVKNLPFDISGHTVISYEDRTNFKVIKSALSSSIDEAVNKAISSSNLTYEILKIAQKTARAEEKDHIYYKLLETQVKRVNYEIERWLLGRMELQAQDMIAKGLEIFEDIKKGGFVTFFAPIEGYWEDNNKYIIKSREIASDSKRNLTLERVYILSSISSFVSNQLKNNIEEDDSSGIKTFVVFKDEISSQAVKDFGIWDKSLVCIINTKETGAQRYEVVGGELTKHPEDIDRFNKYKNEIKRHAIDGSMFVKEVNSLTQERMELIKTVVTMEELSKAHCEGGYISESTCSWYHTSWQYLRLLNMVSTPSWHGDFYLNGLLCFTGKEEQTRVLISGTADYGMLQQITRIPNACKLKEIMIIDLCKTPLLICDEYNKKYHGGHLKINTLKQDITNNTVKNESYDIIMTDAFLTRFDNKNRKIVVEQWGNLLTPKGKIVTTVRVESGEKKIVTGKEDVNRFVQKVRNALKSPNILNSYIKDKTINSARVYAENITSFPFQNEGEIWELFKGYDLTVSYKNVDGEIRDSTRYAQIVAVKASNKRLLCCQFNYVVSFY